MASTTLLWVNDDSTLGNAHEISCIVKQHVMVDYHNKKAQRQSARTKRSQQITSQPDDVQEERAVAVHKNPPRSRITSKATRASSQVAYFPPPKPGLIDEEHRAIYQAAWWHRYALPGSPPSDRLDWQQKCKNQWNEQLWELAKVDKTMLEVFMCFAAAKQNAVRHSYDTRGYYRHKGRAIALVYQDVNREGSSLRALAVAAVCLLCKIAFTEGDYEASDAHCRVTRELTYRYMQQLPGFLWLSLVWGDLRMTAVCLRRPYLAFYHHPEFYFPHPFEGESRSGSIGYISRCVLAYPVVATDFCNRIVRLLPKLHELAYAFDKQDLDWTVPWGISYEIAWLLAEIQPDIDLNGTIEEKVIHVGCQMQFWGMFSPFVPQTGIQPFQLGRLAHAIGSIQPEDLCEQWLQQIENLDLLLWCLCNAAGSALHYSSDSKHASLANNDMTWLQHHITHITNVLGIADFAGLSLRLGKLPFSQMWNGAACRAFITGVQRGHIHTTDITLFKDLGLIFESFPSTPILPGS